MRRPRLRGPASMAGGGGGGPLQHVRNMRRLAFHFAPAVSVLLCAVTVAAWVRSYWHFDDVHLFPDPQRFWLLRSAEGRLHVQQTWASAPLWQGRPTEHW